MSYFPRALQSQRLGGGINNCACSSHGTVLSLLQVNGKILFRLLPDKSCVETFNVVCLWSFLVLHKFEWSKGGERGGRLHSFIQEQARNNYKHSQERNESTKEVVGMEREAVETDHSSTHPKPPNSLQPEWSSLEPDFDFRWYRITTTNKNAFWRGEGAPIFL